MLFTLAVGLLSAIWFGARSLVMKLKYLTPGKTKAAGGSLPLVIFSDDKRYWQTFEPVVRELDARGFDVTYLTASEDDAALSASYPHLKAEFIGKGNKAFAKMNFLKASIVLSSTPGLDVYQWKRSKDVRWYVHLPHGANDHTTGYRMFGLDFYDAVMMSGDYQEQAMRELEKLRHRPAKESVMVGVPYLDDMVLRLNRSPEPATHPRTVLVAPTWGESSLLNRFGSALIDPLLESGYHIIIRPHPQSFSAEKDRMEELMRKYPSSSRLEWNRDAHNYEVLRRSDIMISDYSGVILDFAFVFDKPVICADTEMDTRLLDAWWLGKPLWVVTALPKIGPMLTQENLPSIKGMIDSAIEDVSYARSRHEARDETWTCRGEGARRVADYLIRKYDKIRKNEGSR